MRTLLAHIGILSPAFVATVIAVAMASVILLVRQAVRLRRPRYRSGRPRTKRWPAMVCAVFAVLVSIPAAAATIVNYHYEFLPNMAAVAGLKTWPSAPLPRVLTAFAVAPEPSSPAMPVARPKTQGPRFRRGVVTRLPIRGVTSGFGTRVAYVYLPPQYFTEPGRRFPVAYLLHGAPGAPIDWFRAGDAAGAGLAAARADHPMILVAPQLSRSWLSDSECVNGVQGNVETYLSRDVPSAVDATFRTEPDRSARLLVGLSAGGFCALNAGLQHRDEFGAFADLSGLDRPTHTGGPQALYGNAQAAQRLEAADSPYLYVPTMTPSPTVRAYLSVARTDHGPYDAAARMNRELTNAHQPVTLHVAGGSHNYAFWRAQLPDALTWWQG